jgi:ATP-dependent Clp protease adaptor protein ClpS
MAARSSIHTHPLIRPSIIEQIEQAGQDSPEPEWQVIVYDTDTNTYEEVMTVLVIATACTVEEAYVEAWEIDHFGSCIVHRATEAECRDAAEVIKTIEIPVEVRPAE